MISAIVLGAGESKRMGAHNKLLLPFGEKTLIETIVENVLSSEAQEVIVVLGHDADQVQAVLQDQPVRFVYNARYPEGMTSSIQAGIHEVSADTQGLMICLSDLPFVRSADLNRLIGHFEAAWATHEKLIVLPTFEGQRGHPVIFSVYYKAQLLQHQEANGCRGVIQQHMDQVLSVEMPSSHVMIDIDTPDDYKQVIQQR